MKILFIHQNFPGQFKFLAPALISQGHQVLAMSMQAGPSEWQGVRIVRYAAQRGTTPGIHPWVTDIETKTIRGEACYRKAREMKQEGFTPDIIIAHPGWGESLFIKDVWPNARLGIYCEFFYHAHGADVGFDPEFPTSEDDFARIRLKNINNLLHIPVADAGISPTHWQASTFPEPLRSRISIIHDGIDTQVLAPNEAVSLTLNNSVTLTRKDEIITFVNRNLEPYRGYHIFMRALPEILRQRPNARVLIVGGDGVSYGAAHQAGRKWKDVFIEEVRPKISESDWQRVHFLGNLAYELFIPLLQLSSVHVYLTYPFVLSWSLLEAMSIGCAIVASDTAPLREAILHDQTGRLVDFFDSAALAESICTLLADTPARARLGQAAREFARQPYDLASVCQPQQLAWIETLAARP